VKTTQLRSYMIKAGQLDRFTEVWSKNVRPLRTKQKAYYESPERKAMDPDPSSFIVGQSLSLIDPV